MTPPDELWRLSFMATFPLDKRVLHGCDCYGTLEEAEAAAAHLRLSPIKYQVEVSHYRRVTE